MKAKLLKWAWGMAGGCIGGGASAAVSYFSMAGVKAAGMDVPALNLKALGVIFLSGVITNGLLYLKQSPLPPLNGDTTFTQKTEVTTTIKEPPISKTSEPS